HHFEDTFVRCAYFSAEEFDDAQDVTVQHDGKAKGAVYSSVGGVLGTWEVSVFGYIDDPRRLGSYPHSTRQTDPWGKDSLASLLFKLGRFGARPVPRLYTAQYTHLLVHPPNGTHFPTQVFANCLDDLGSGIAQCCRFGQDPRRRVLHGQTTL